MRPPTILLAAGAFLLLSAPARAQSAEPPTYAFELPYRLDSGVLANAAERLALLDGQRIEVAGAPSLRVFFHAISLGPDDYLDVVGLLDGHVHRIRTEEIVKWSSSSVFFNGDALELELYVAPGSQASYSVSHLLVGAPGDAGESICGEDDRVPTVDARIARFLGGSPNTACTGWLSGPENCAFTAGHCFPTYAAIAEFNVPPSQPSGAFVHPPPEFQFPVGPELFFLSGGLGNDYGICHLLTNPLGEGASAKFGWFDLGFFFPSPADPIRISGYGKDAGTANHVLQTQVGPYVAAAGFTLRYQTDTESGNSGSPVIDESTGDAIGIHTHGGCGGAGHNSGTSLNQPSFLATWAQACDHDTLAGDKAELSLSAGGVLTLTLEAGLLQASDGYWLLGSLSGSFPGTAIGGITLPLNTPDPYFMITLLNPNQPPLQGSLGVLDAGGAAQATVTLPPGTSAALAGVEVNHAYVAFDPLLFAPTLVSNASAVLLVP